MTVCATTHYQHDFGRIVTHLDKSWRWKVWIISDESRSHTFGFNLLIQVYGGSNPGGIANNPGGVPMAGQVFGQVDISRS